MTRLLRKSPIITWGMGELGSVISRGFLKLGHPVYPVTRDNPIDLWLEGGINPLTLLIAVGEADLHSVLRQIPTQWKDRVILIQNELLPQDWQAAQLINPTVLSVWFEKKPGMDSKVVQSSPVFGPHAQEVVQALAKLKLPAVELNSTDALVYELVVKNLYILTTNIAGLKVGGNVSDLENKHSKLLNEVAKDVIDLQEALCHKTFDRAALMDSLKMAFHGDLHHQCLGRSGPARLKRALALGDEHKLSLQTLRKIAKEVFA